MHAHLYSVQTKKQYEKASEEAENAMHTLEKADNDPNSTKAKIDKVNVHVHLCANYLRLEYFM